MKTNIISGNFSAAIEGTLNEQASINVGSEEKPEQANVGDVIREAGLTYIVQRDGLSKVYKALLGKGEKRNTVEFSPDTATKFQDALAKSLAPYGDFSVVVDQHEPSEAGASPMVRATAFVDSLLDDGDKETQLRATLALFDPAATEADRDGLVAIAHKQGLGIQPPKAPKAKA